MKTKNEDMVKDLFITSNHQSLLSFTNFGRVYDFKVYRLPEAALTGEVLTLQTLIKLNEGEKVVSVLPVKEFTDGSYILSVTKNGYVKKTDLMAYSNLRVNGIIGLKLEEGDSLIGCGITHGERRYSISYKIW